MAKELDCFENWPFVVPDLDKACVKIEKLVEEMNNASDGPTALAVYKKMGKFTDKIMDDLTHISVLYSLETTNEEYSKANEYVDNNSPKLSAYMQEFTKAMINSKHRDYLEEKLGEFIFTMFDYSLKSFDEKIIEEAVEENNLVTEYMKVQASVRIKFRGEEYNMSQMGKFLTSNDRETRKEASNAYYKALDSFKDTFEEIYDKLVKVRTRMAKKMGYESYTDLAYIRMSRYDYTPEMVASYRDQIAEVVTPIATKLAKEQAKLLGLKSLKVYDLGSHFQNGNPIPNGTTEDKVNAAKKIYKELSPDTDYFFNFMVDHHLMFLDAKPGKQSGGYMTYFPVHKCPIIFSNFNGTSGDVDVLTHEFGHSFQAYAARNIAISEYRAPTMESCECHSMSMEFFAEPYMSYFFDNPDKYRYVHLADSISFLPYGVTVDEFQHWVYANPDATPAERDAKWHELEVKYTPYKVKAYKGCKYMEEGHRWLTQNHIFASPFYYIDYTLAQVIAFEFFNLDRKNHEKAWKKYMKLCKMGGKYPFVTLINNVGLKSPFEPGVLKKTVRPLVKVLKDYHPENF
ncbi:MAG: M3 family oligoendopeptidase [Bacilli bacterium]|nr:M3 family oligoendopeptidase [Bacilli bacterium]